MLKSASRLSVSVLIARLSSARVLGLKGGAVALIPLVIAMLRVSTQEEATLPSAAPQLPRAAEGRRQAASSSASRIKATFLLRRCEAALLWRQRNLHHLHLTERKSLWFIDAVQHVHVQHARL